MTDADATIYRLTARLGLGQHRLKCPFCQHTRQKHRNDKPLSVNVDADGAQWRCWHCEAEGGWMDTMPDEFSSAAFATPTPFPTVQVQPPTNRVGQASPTISHVEYLVNRGIDEEVAKKYTVQGDQWVNGKMQSCVGFPYRGQGESPDPTKWRAIDEKGYTQTGACRTFWLKETHEKGNAVLICEGELDALAWLSAGLPDGITVLSIPNGAPNKMTQGDPNNQADTKYRYLWDAREIIERAPKVYINADNDRPGQILEAELLRRIHNPNRFIVKLGEHKDAADVLATEGPTRLRKYFEEAGRPPMKGIHRATDYLDEIMARWEKGDGQQFSCGLKSVDLYTTFAPGLVTVMTGHPGAGKSNFIDQVCVNMALEHGWKSLLANMEKQPRRHIPELIQKIRAHHWRDLSHEEVVQTIHMIDEHLFFLDRSDKTSPDTITGILDEASKMVMQEGIRLLVVDPYNYLAREGDLSETEYVAFMMKSLSDWAKQHDCHVILVAHPAKPENRTVGKKFPPGGYDISGSAHFYNVTDLGITMHRTKEDENELHVWKVRFDDLGQLGAVKLGFNPSLGIWYDLPDWRIVGEFGMKCEFPPLANEPDDLSESVRKMIDDHDAEVFDSQLETPTEGETA